MAADYELEFPCKCGGKLQVFIDYNDGDEYIKCENGCPMDVDWLNSQVKKDIFKTELVEEVEVPKEEAKPEQNELFCLIGFN